MFLGGNKREEVCSNAVKWVFHPKQIGQLLIRKNDRAIETEYANPIRGCFDQQSVEFLTLTQFLLGVVHGGNIMGNAEYADQIAFVIMHGCLNCFHQSRLFIGIGYPFLIGHWNISTNRLPVFSLEILCKFFIEKVMIGFAI